MRPVLALLLPLGLVLLAGCRSSSLEVKGALNRAIGETVTLDLQEGEPVFSGDVTLRDAAGTVFKADALRVGFDKQRERLVSFVVPPDAAQGGALVRAAQRSEYAVAWEVTLRLNRLALTLDDKTLTAWPLPPATLDRPPAFTATGAAPRLVALTPDGGAAALVNGGEVRFLSLGAELKDISPPITQAGIVALAGTPGGALVATAESLILFRFAKGQPVTQSPLALPGVKAIAVTAGGGTAMALSACDTNADKTPDADCLTEVTLSPALGKGREVVLDSTPSAIVVGVTHDGRGAIVADADTIYGVWFEGATPRVSKVGWSDGNAQPFTQAQPVGGGCALTTIQGDTPHIVDAFAIGERTKNLIVLVAFNPDRGNDLFPVARATLAEKPVSLAFGRRTELYVAGERSLYTLDAAVANPTVTKLAISSVGAILGFVVQP